MEEDLKLLTKWKTSIMLLVLNPQPTRSSTLTVAFTHPGTNPHNCSLTSTSKVHTPIDPLYLSFVHINFTQEYGRGVKITHKISPSEVLSLR